MPKTITPTDIAPPFSKYAHAIEVDAGSRLLFVSGQVGIRPDGTMCETEEEQHEQAWRNLAAVLGAAGLGLDDLVEVTVYVTGRSGVPVFRATRDRMLAGRLVATTLVIAAGLAGVDWKVEIAAVAAKSA
jgi:enamine deaminase RidA (YjgF/YER057c/UK114 family)